MARAVIGLSGDISYALPRISRAIAGCVYSLEAKAAVFRFEDMRVIIEGSQIIVYGAKDEAAARKIIGLLSDFIKSDNKNEETT